MSKTTRIAALVLILTMLLLGVTACSTDTAKVTGIQLAGEYRNVYLVGEDLDLSGMELLLENSDGTTSTVNIADVRSDIKFLNVNTDAVTKQLEITIQYQKQKTTFTIDVVNPQSDENRVNVVFDLNIASLDEQSRKFQEIKVLQLSKLNAPSSSPTRVGYAFDGWYKDTALKNPWNFSVDQVILTSQHTLNTVYLYAKWTPYCEVTFYKILPSGETTLIATKMVKKGGSLTDFPNIPIDAGEEKYIFEWDYSSFESITENIEVYTKEPVLKTYNVEFYDKINDADQLLYILEDVPYGTDLLDPSTVLTTQHGAQISPLQEIGLLSPSNRENHVFANAWDYKGLTYHIANPQTNNPLRNVKQSMQLYAHYEIKTFTVSFDLNYQGQSITPPSPQVVAHNTPIIDITVTRDGYDFDGWYKDAQCTRPWNFNTEKVTENRTLYAKWTKLFKIDFYAIYYGDVVGGTERQPAMDNSSLLYYQNNDGIWEDSNGNEMFASSTIDPQMTDPVGGFLYNYIKKDNVIAYTRVLIGEVMVRQGETASALPSVYSSQVTLDGHTAKWSSTSFVNIQEDRSVYAIYTIRTYNVKFVDGENQIGPTQVIPYKGKAIAPNDTRDENLANKVVFDNYVTTTRWGYSFSGWNSLAYLNVTEDTTISATFTPNTYRVTVQLSPGNTEVRNELYDSVLTLITPNREAEGYDFDGWYTTPDYAPGSEWGADDKVTGNISIYAKWVEIYTITFTDGATTNPLVLATRKVRKGNSLTDIPVVPEIVGKNGIWREDGAIPNFQNVQRDMIIAATYTDKTFNVNFKNGNHDDYFYLANVLYNTKVVPPLSPEDPSQAVPDPDASYVGYQFEGWTVAGVTGYVNFSTYQIKQDTTFIASYSRRTFTVLFVDNDYDSTGVVLREVTIEYEAIAYPPANPLKTGMNFLGWSTDKITVSDDLSITGDTVFYAVYQIKEYNVTFKSIEDNTTWATVKVEHGELAAYPSDIPQPTYNGFTFTGWDYDFNTPITSHKNIFAIFQINTYTITFVTGEGSTVDPVTATHNSYAIAPQQPTYENMAFLGWYLDEMYSVQYLFDQPMTSNLTLYAKWSEYVSGFGDIVFQLNSENTAYTVVSVNPDALAVKIDNFYQNKPVTSIGSGAFRNNQRLRVVILPDTLQTIGTNAFEGCVNLLRIDIPQPVTSIGDNAFNGCINLSAATFTPNSALTTIGNYAFINARSLTGLALPDTVTNIGSGAFMGCSSLYSLEVPRGVTTIGASAFENCIGLKYLIFLRPSPCILGEYAFDGVTQSFRLYVQDVLAYTSGVTSNWQAVGDRICPSGNIASDWYYSLIQVGAHANKLRLLHYLGNDTDLAVPETLTVEGVERTVYSLGDYLFDGKVTAFKMNSDMPLSANTFGSASGLMKLEVSIVNELGEQRELLNSNITYIRNAFETINSLKELSISAVATLKNLFGNVNPPANLKKVNILNDRTELPADMFYNCLNIEEITIPASIQNIGNYAFYGCYNLHSVSIAPISGLTSIGESAFENCVSLQQIAIPDSVTVIESNAFKATPYVTNSDETFVVLGDGILYSYNGNDETVILPKEIKQINEYAFYGASLRSFMFEEGSVLQSVGDYAFAECVNLEHAVFPETMASLGEGAFYNDTKLSKVIFFLYDQFGVRIYIADTTSIFTNCMHTLEIIVPLASSSRFLESDNNWEEIIREQLDYPGWSGLSSANLYFNEEWIYSLEAGQGITLLQYYGSNKDLVIPSQIGSDEVIELANYTIPRNTITLDFSVSVASDSRVFGALNGLTEVTIRDTTNATFIMEKDYIYNMLAANRSLHKINVGGKMSIYSILGDRLPPSNITAVTVFDGETSLADEMFKDCQYIVDIELPDSLTDVGKQAFNGSGWENAYDGEFVTILRDLDGRGLLVSYKGNQKHVVIPSDVKAINRMLFENNAFVEIVSANNLEAIYDNAFAGAETLSKIILGGDAPSFGTEVFKDLMEGAQLFADEDKLAGYLSADLTGIELVANHITVSGDYMLQTLDATHAVLLQYTGGGSDAEIPVFVGDYEIVSIGNNALYSDIQNLTFRVSDILTQYSFGNLKLLQSVTILDTNNILCDKEYIYTLLTENINLTKISYNGGDCTLIDLLNGNSPVASINTVEVIDGATSIIDGMLQEYANITNIILPSTIQTIGLYAFENTAWYAAQPDFVIILDGYLYKYKGTESNVTVPNTVKVIGERAFADYREGVWVGNMYVRSLKFEGGSSATTILSEAFLSCALLTKIDLPWSLTQIAENAFDGTGMAVENDTLLARGDRGDALIRYYGTSSQYELSAGVITINASAFESNEYLTDFVIPQDSLLVMIGPSAFKNCINLSSVTINNGGVLSDVTDILALEYIEDIGADAFAGTPWMQSLGNYLFGNGRLLLAKNGDDTLVLSDSDKPAGYELNMIASSAFASSHATKLYIDMISPLSLGLGSLDSLSAIYVPYDLYGIFVAYWNGYASKLIPVHVAEGSFVNAAGQLVYVNKTDTAIVLTDHCGLTEIAPDAFVGTAATTLVLTSVIPPVMGGDWLHGINTIYVAPEAVDAYKAAWSSYASSIQSYTLLQEKFLVYDNILYQYDGNEEVVTVPIGIQEIAGHAFANANNIKFLFVPSDVTTVQSYAYFGLQNAAVAAELSNIEGWSEDFAANLLGLHTSVSAGVAGIEGDYITKPVSGGAEIIRYLGNQNSVTIPDSIAGQAVYGIASKAFAGNPNIIRITLPSSVEIVAENAFYGCESLTVIFKSAAIPSGCQAGWNNWVEESYVNGNSEFSDAYGNQYINNAGNAVLIKAVSGHESMSISLAGGLTVKTIAANAFAEVTGLRSLRLSDTIINVGISAFIGCEQTVLYLDASQVPATWATGWTDFVLDYYTDYKKVFTVNDGGAEGTGFKMLLNEGALIIIDYQGDPVDLVIPNTAMYYSINYYVTEISCYAFYNKTMLESVTLNAEMKKISAYAFAGCTALTSIDWNSKLEAIGTGAFSNNAWLDGQNYIIDQTTLYLYADAANTAVIPSEITNVIDGAFSMGIARYAVFTMSVPPEVADNAFIGVQTVLVPQGYLEVYRAAWPAYADFIQAYTEVNGAMYYRNTLVYYNGDGEELTVPSSIEGYIVNEISDKAFLGSASLKKLVLPSSISTMGESVFLGCSNLVIYLEGDNSFAPDWSAGAMYVYADTSSQTIVVNGVRYFEELNAFTVIGVEEGYKEVFVESTVNGLDVIKIGHRAFAGGGLYKVTLPVSIQTIDATAFQGADNTVLIILADTLPDETNGWSADINEIYVGESNFVTAGDYTVFANGDTAVLFGYNGSLNGIALPDTVADKTLTGIASYAFLDASLFKIVLNESMDKDSISAKAFAGMTAECVVYVRQNININDYAWAEDVYEAHADYQEYDSGDYKVIPMQLEEESGLMIVGSTISITDYLEIPSSLAVTGLGTLPVIGIASYAFSLLLSNPYAVIIPESVSYIGGKAFSKIEEYGTASNVFVESENAKTGFAEGWDNGFSDTFYNCNAAATVNGVVYLADGDEAVVVGYTGDSSVAVIEGKVIIDGNSFEVTKIAAYAFAFMPHLTRIFIPDSVISVRDRIAYESGADVVMSLEHSMVASYWPVGWNNFGAQQVKISSQLVASNDLLLLFHNNTLSVIRYSGTDATITIPESVSVGANVYEVTAIEPYAFYHSDAYRIYVPESVDSIGEFAFADCDHAILFIGDTSSDPSWDYTYGGSTIAYDSDVKYTYYNYTAFEQRGGFRYVLDGISAHIVDYVGTDTELEIEDTIIIDMVTYEVNAIGPYAFAFLTDITKIILPDTINMVYQDAFLGTSNAALYLTHVMVPVYWPQGWEGDTLHVTLNAANTCEEQLFQYICYTPEVGQRTATITGFSGGSVSELTIPASFIHPIDGLNYKVTRIAEYAFANRTELSSVNLPQNEDSNLTEIGAYAFYRCIRLSTISNFDSKIVNIGENAFQSTLWYQNISDKYLKSNDRLRLYTGNESAVIFDAQTQIDILGGAFASSEELKYVVFLDGIKPEVHSDAFVSVEKILVPEANLQMYQNLWPENSHKIDSFHEENGMLFYQNKLIAIINKVDTDLTIPQQVEDYTIDTILSHVDKTGRDTLLSLTIPRTVTTIGPNTFPYTAVYFEVANRLEGYSTAFTALEEYFDIGEFFHLEGATFAVIDGKAKLINYYGDAKEYTIPLSVFYNGTDYEVSAIGSYAFAQNNYVKSVYLPKGIDSIGVYAFRTAFSGPQEPEFILYTGLSEDSYPWYNNWEMPVYFNIPKVQSQGSMRYVVTDDGITITQYFGTVSVFDIPQSLTINQVAISVTAIGAYAFYNVSSLANITIPSSVRMIGKHAFTGTKWLQDAGDFIVDNSRLLLYNGEDKNVTIEESSGIRSIVGGAFLSSRAFRLVINGDTPMIELYDHAFDGIEIIDVPSVASDIYREYIWTNYQSMIIGSVRIGEYGFSLNPDGTAKIIGYYGESATPELPSSVTVGERSYTVNELGDKLFKGRTELIQIILPRSIQYLGENVFTDCNNTVVYLRHEVIPAWPTGWYNDLLHVYSNIDNFVAIGDYTVQLNAGNHELTIVQYNGVASSVAISSMIYGASEYTVTRIGYYAFYHKTFVSEVTMAVTVEQIDKYAFEGTAWASNGTDKKVFGNKLMLYTGSATSLTISETDAITAICGGAFASSDVTVLDITAEATITLDEGALQGIQTIYVNAATVDEFKDLWPQYAEIITARP
ncbi:MAG: leucine-rich repeat protein [Clostridia bacterium]|nr:leucine-rich repeat protein [Clostridia bacterium]